MFGSGANSSYNQMWCLFTSKVKNLIEVLGCLQLSCGSATFYSNVALRYATCKHHVPLTPFRFDSNSATRHYVTLDSLLHPEFQYMITLRCHHRRWRASFGGDARKCYHAQHTPMMYFAMSECRWLRKATWMRVRLSRVEWRQWRRWWSQ